MSQDREKISPEQMMEMTEVNDGVYPKEKINKLYGNIMVPSFVHGYSIAIEYMRDWILSKFPKDFFNTVYIDGRHVLDEYKHFSRMLVKGKNPRLRIEPKIDYDYDRDGLDNYIAPPSLYVRKSKFNEAFFKDYERDMFLAFQPKALRMTFNFRIRVNSRAQQADLYQKMLLNFRVGSTMSEWVSVDFHVPKEIMLNIAEKAGFEIKDDKIVDVISFLNYLNMHSDIPFLFKIRAINQKAEFFIRMNKMYFHINCIEKPQVDDGERDGKLDFNFHIDMQAILTIPIPQMYVFYSASDLTVNINTHEDNKNTVAIYSINPFEIPKIDENGWNIAAVTEFATDKGDTYMDLSDLFKGDNVLARSVEHDLTNGISPSHFIHIAVFHHEDIAKLCDVTMDWGNKIAYFDDGPQNEEVFYIAIYYDRKYMNELDIELNNYNQTRLQS